MTVRQWCFFYEIGSDPADISLDGKLLPPPDHPTRNNRHVTSALLSLGGWRASGIFTHLMKHGASAVSHRLSVGLRWYLQWYLLPKSGSLSIWSAYIPFHFVSVVRGAKESNQRTSVVSIPKIRCQEEVQQ